MAAVGCAVIAISALAAVPPAEAAGPAANPAPLSLPVPTGRYAVGEVFVHLVDHSRPDPWQSGQNRRELMVSVYYPTTRAAGHPAAPYMLPQAAAHFDSVTANVCLGMNVPTGQVEWAATTTHVVQGAPVADGGGKRPALNLFTGTG
ncbi:hypothetical protein GCM10023084_61440 [Streptomyces lacrimifluminis]|uniref:Secreted protein n=1 Tax=Streptomyces lacrimifluminis TaxID=1500077 RepID=A0A917L5Z4_9ACTN|nr:hypothetical protein [Streptomyces lacrimifluminis]GGJ44115.1 hypothetical protein GCM10012282_46280 [Streptomyces lacrimifluminis]